VAKHKCTYF